jgi:hypothetical protein
MIRIDPGTSFMLYLGPGPPSLLYLTRANETLPKAGDTLPRLVRRLVAASKLGEFLQFLLLSQLWVQLPWLPSLMLSAPMVGLNWMPCLASGCILRIILVSFVFHRSDKILPLFRWCSNPHRALVAIPTTPLALLVIAAALAVFSVATALAAVLFH